MTHLPSCRWERTTLGECEYRDTHHYCPHEEHACTCPPRPPDEPRVVGLAAWEGVALDTFVYQLAGALSRVMLPDHEEMPSERIQRTVEAFYARGPL